MNDSRLKILMVDDDDIDIFSMRRAFQKHASVVDFIALEDGLALQTFLNEHCSADSRTTETTRLLILLDINMPIRNGFDTLAALRADHRFKYLPIIVLSTSSSESDIRKCYGLGANSFATKPSTLEETHRLVASVCAYWAQSITVPALASA